MKYEYFVSYFQGNRFGRATLHLKKEINDEESISFVEKLIDKNDKNAGNGTVLLNFKLLKCNEPTELPSAAAAESEVYGNDCKNGQC